MSITEVARKIPHWQLIPDSMPDEVSTAVFRRHAMTALAAEAGGHIETVVDAVIGTYLAVAGPVKEWISIPSTKTRRLEILDKAAISDDPTISAAVDGLWVTMIQHRGTLIDEATQRLIEKWLKYED